MNVPDIHEAGEPVPGPVRLAGTVWVGCGAVAALVAAAAGLLAADRVLFQGADRSLGVAVIAAAFAFACAAFFVRVGNDVRTGAAGDVDGPAWLALIFGPTALLPGVGVLAAYVLSVGGVGLRELIAAGWLAVTGGLLTASGVLALRSRWAYLRWRVAHRPRDRHGR